MKKKSTKPTAKKAAIKKAPTKKKSAVKKKPKKILEEIDFEKLQKETEKSQEKIPPVVPKNKVPKPKFKRVKVYENGIEMYLPDNRKVSIAQETDGSFIVETKKVLKPEEPFSVFSPAKVRYLKRWGIKLASMQINISREALIAIGMGISEMLKKGVFQSEK